MAAVPQPKYTDLARLAGSVVTAHAAVAAGIATHVQKEVAAKDERRRALELARSLSAPLQVKGV